MRLRYICIICQLVWFPSIFVRSFCLLGAQRIQIRFRSSDVSSMSKNPALFAYDLNSAYEWLAEERHLESGYELIQWLDLQPSSSSTMSISDPSTSVDESERMPLYPLGAVYLPSRVNHTIINVEPQNLRMAQDLLASGNPRFCATLRATDTGRLANIGTILRIIDSEEQYYDDHLVRIRLTCQAEKQVEIKQILNPEAFGRENRLRKTDEYLQAWVGKLGKNKYSFLPQDDIDPSDLINTYNMIKTIYQLEIGSKGLPPSTLFQLGNAMSLWTAGNFESEATFWEAAQEWQSVCYSIRQGKQAMLSTDRNEMMISSIKGPLKLPIHPADLEPNVRRQVEELQLKYQADFFDLQLDPCLDFQVLLSMPKHTDRMSWLSSRLNRERHRLEIIASQTSKVR